MTAVVAQRNRDIVAEVESVSIAVRPREGTAVAAGDLISALGNAWLPSLDCCCSVGKEISRTLHLAASLSSKKKSACTGHIHRYSIEIGDGIYLKAQEFRPKFTGN